MPSVAFQKQEQKRWLTQYFEIYIAGLDEEIAKEFAMFLVQRLMKTMSLRELKEWSNNLENKQ